MKKLYGVFLIIVLLSGLWALFKTGSLEKKWLGNEKEDVVELKSVPLELDENSNSSPQANLETNNTAGVSDRAEPPKEQRYGEGVDLKINGDELESSYKSESVNDYGWKSYWENEIYVLLMDSTRRYPLVEQSLDCKSNTCKVEVKVAAEHNQYLVQALGAMDEEFSKRGMSVALKSIDVKSGVINLFVQPGEIERVQ